MAQKSIDYSQKESKKVEYSEAYKKIQEAANKDWPAWKVFAYNTSIATSAHAKKVLAK